VEGAPLAVTDTGPLIALHAVALLDVLCARFAEVLIPLTVWSELTALPEAPEPAAVQRLLCVRIVPDVAALPLPVQGLDPGEQQALAIALASPDTFFVLVDDGAARRVARATRLRHIGTIGLIAVAKTAGICSSARDKYASLLRGRFRIDLAVVNDVLRELGEPELDPLESTEP
jgi:predicted nucleic acid-binding protein